MVYNFNVNDTFQIHSSGNQCCFSDALYSLDSKTYSLNGDTVIYGVKVNTRDFHGNAMQHSSTVTTNSYTTTWKYYDLSMPLTTPTLTSNSYYYQKDTTILDYCNKLTLKSQAYCYSNYECDSKIEKYSSGLGHTYSYFFSYQETLITAGYQPITIDLVYYHKVGEPPCGMSSVGLILGVNKNNIYAYDINFYPNPTKDKLYISAGGDISTVEFADVYGKTFCFNLENNSINLNTLNSGVYFLRKINNTFSNKNIKIIKTD